MSEQGGGAGARSQAKALQGVGERQARGSERRSGKRGNGRAMGRARLSHRAQVTPSQGTGWRNEAVLL